MPKFIGNRFGNVVPVGPGSNAGPAVYDMFDQYYASQETGWVADGITATGGIINEYTEPSGVIYRSHTFLDGGVFSVTDLGDLGGTVDILVVGGGAGGNGALTSYWTGSGGGAGGMAVATSYPVSTSPGSYPITVGAGGQASATGPSGGNFRAQSGSPSVFTNPSSPQTITALGGGAGGTGGSNPPGGYAGQAGLNGGSGGGGGPGPGSSSGGTGQQPSQNPGIPNLTNYGNDGAAGDSSSTVGRAGGGGGAGGNAEAIDSAPALTTNNAGGPGVANAFRFGPGNSLTYAAGGGVLTPSSGAPNPTANFFVPAAGLGHGGGGGCDGPGGEPGGNGGSGCVVIRYKLGVITASAKASGGSISYYGGKTIHTFTTSGTMTFPTAFNETVEYVVIGGGGSGGLVYGGGGGAGAYRTGTTAINATPAQISLTVTIGAGGAGESNTTGGLNPSTNGKVGRNGSPSSVNFPAGTITSAGGGYGGAWVKYDGGPGGSGGGGGAENPNPAGDPGGTGSGDPFPGTIGATPSNGWGNDGGTGGAYNEYGSGGGGGAGGVGQSVPAGNLNKGRDGGAGIQLPATFRDPMSTVGASGPTSAPSPNGFDSSGKYWVAGGGASGIGGASGLSRGNGGGAPAPAQTYAGGGFGGFSPVHPTSSPYPSNLNAGNGGQATGGGGGGGAGTGQGNTVNTFGNGGSGGSGLVLVAYPT